MQTLLREHTYMRNHIHAHGHKHIHKDIQKLNAVIYHEPI